MKPSKRLSAFWHGPQNILLKENAIPILEPGSVLLKVESCAVCGSDLRIYKEGNSRITPPHIIGHEISGTIVEIGKGVEKFNIGDRIAIGADVPCGKCIHCTSDRPNCCDINYAMGYQFEGGFSEYLVLDPLVVEIGPVTKFSDSISFDAAALAEPLACCINGYEVGLFKGTGTVVVFGAGPIGILLAMIGKVYGATKIILIDINKSRLERAHNYCESALLINSLEMNPVEEVLALTNGKGADLVFTACPAVEAHEQAIRILGKRGVANLFGGLPKTASSISLLSNFIHYKEAYITGSHGSTPKQHKMAMELIEQNKIDTSSLITHSYSLHDIDRAFSMAQSGEALKVMVKPNV